METRLNISLFSLVIVLGDEGIQLLTLVGVSVKIKDKQRNTSLTSRALQEFAENFITWLISRLRLQNNYLCHFDLVVCNAVSDYVADCLKNWDSDKEWGIFQSVAFGNYLVLLQSTAHQTFPHPPNLILHFVKSIYSFFDYYKALNVKQCFSRTAAFGVEI